RQVIDPGAGEVEVVEGYLGGDGRDPEQHQQEEGGEAEERHGEGTLLAKGIAKIRKHHALWRTKNPSIPDTTLPGMPRRGAYAGCSPGQGKGSPNLRRTWVRNNSPACHPSEHRRTGSAGHFPRDVKNSLRPGRSLSPGTPMQHRTQHERTSTPPGPPAGS